MVRKKFTAKIKAQVALEAAKNDKTIPEISTKHGVHPTQVKQWKAVLEERAEVVFQKENKVTDSADTRIAELERKVGQLTMENDFLKKNYFGSLKKNGLPC